MGIEITKVVAPVRIVDHKLYIDAGDQLRVAVRYEDDTEEDRPATSLEAALLNSIALSKAAALANTPTNDAANRPTGNNDGQPSARQLSADSSQATAAPSWRLVRSDSLPPGAPVDPGTTLYAFYMAPEGSHWEYDLPNVPDIKK